MSTMRRRRGWSGWCNDCERRGSRLGTMVRCRAVQATELYVAVARQRVSRRIDETRLMHSDHVQVLDPSDKFKLYLMLRHIFKTCRVVTDHCSVCTMAPAHQLMLLVQYTCRLISLNQSILQMQQ